MRKTIITSMFIIAFTISGFAQSSKDLARAEKYVQKFNATIVSVDPGLKLSDEQQSKIKAIQLERIAELSKITETDKAKRRELAKPINKKYGQRINKEVLTKKQLKAYQKGKNIERKLKKK